MSFPDPNKLDVRGISNATVNVTTALTTATGGVATIAVVDAFAALKAAYLAKRVAANSQYVDDAIRHLNQAAVAARELHI